MITASKAFFDAARPVFGGKLDADQVKGLTVLLDAWQRYGNSQTSALAYCLATAKWETAHTMQPIYERGPKAYFDKYEPGTKLGKALGNTLKGDGFKYRGRGFVQLTGRRNYAKAAKALGIDLVANPDLALAPHVAARILVTGMLQGWFTTATLTKYIDGIDEADDEDLREYVAARRVVNGTDKAAAIGDIALQFEKAITAAAAAPKPEPTTPVAPTPKPVPPSADFWKVLIDFIAKLFISVFSRKKS